MDYHVYVNGRLVKLEGDPRGPGGRFWLAAFVAAGVLGILVQVL